MYTIGQISEMFGIPISTLRYYDKEGLFPKIERQSGIRRFSETEVETLRIIECLKASGLGIKDIKQFMCMHGIVDITMRMLRIRELKLIQGFPEDYVLVGTQSEQKKFIGNAVETHVACALCKCISETINS